MYADPTNYYQKFFILSMPRSGSNYLAYLLGDHPEIISVGEIYNRNRIWGHPSKPEISKSRYLKILRDLFPVWFLKTLIYGKHPSNIKAVGFRFFYSQAEIFPQVANYLFSRKDIKIIHLKRENLLRALVSLRIAEKTGFWVSLKPRLYKPLRIYLRYRECLKYFEENSVIISRYDAMLCKQNSIDINYEELCKSTDTIIPKILSFLGVSDKKLNCLILKQNPYSLKKVIKNYDVLKGKFSNTVWNKYFE